MAMNVCVIVYPSSHPKATEFLDLASWIRGGVWAQAVIVDGSYSRGSSLSIHNGSLKL